MNANFEELRKRLDGVLQEEKELNTGLIAELEKVLSVAFEDGLLSLPVKFRTKACIEVHIAPEIHTVEIAVAFDTKVVV